MDILEFKLTSQSGCLLLEAFSVSHGRASPYLPLIELLKTYFQIEPQDDERKRREDSQDHQGEAEAFLHKALDFARQQKAKSLELRAATSLARLWQQQGKTTEARELLAPVYDWLCEGFETQDLQDAEALLEDLG